MLHFFLPWLISRDQTNTTKSYMITSILNEKFGTLRGIYFTRIETTVWNAPLTTVL